MHDKYTMCNLVYFFRYQQYFDLEGESGIVVRGIGTCVFLIPLRKVTTTSNPATPTTFSISPRDPSGVAQEL